MKVYHTSPAEINKITQNGLFNDCLFFANEPYFMTQVKNPVVYSLQLNKEKIINVNELYDKDIIKDIALTLEVNEELAESFLDNSESVFDHNIDSEFDWWLQAKQGECAKAMGYEAVRAEDEQGAVYIVPMLGRESDLVLVK